MLLMTTPPRSPPYSDIPSKATPRRTRQSTPLRRSTVRSLDQPQPTVNVNPAIGRGSGPHKEKFHGNLGVVAAMKTLTTTLEGKPDQAVPRWIEPKMWCILSDGLKNEWNKWFYDGTSLDKEAMTTLFNKWATYFLQIKNMEFRKI
ncbi:hypothetical protein HKD37_18G050462 [Glycine soja]